jgi:hypothetical protein
MPHVTRQGQVVETATEARQAEPGPSMLIVLTVSVTGVVILMAALYLILFR